MQFEIILFGIAKDIVGHKVLNVSLDVGIVKELKERILENYPAFLDVKSLSIAVNNEYVTDEFKLAVGDEIALIPPVSGG